MNEVSLTLLAFIAIVAVTLIAFTTIISLVIYSTEKKVITSWFLRYKNNNSVTESNIKIEAEEQKN